jgi:hypothetical protein
MSKLKDATKAFITDARKGRLDEIALSTHLKYAFNSEERAFIINRLGKRSYDIAYNNPKPRSHIDIRRHEAYLDMERPLVFELRFFLEGLKHHKKDIKDFILINERLERAMLLMDVDLCVNLLDEMDTTCGYSLYTLLAEYYLNEASNNPQANQTLLKDLTDQKADIKLMIIMDFTRFRIDKDVSSLSYEGHLEQHEKLYDKTTSARYLDYLNFRFELVKYPKISDYGFILKFDSDLSIIDRYQTLKKLLPIILNDDSVNQEIKNEIIALCHDFSTDIEESYWINFNAMFTGGMGPFKDRSGFHTIQNLLFGGQYEKALKRCAEILSEKPNYSELYVPFVQSIIHTGKKIEDIIGKQSPLYFILYPMKSVLDKKDTYLADREKLIKMFFTICHFDFSYHILEFVINEVNITIEQPIQLISFLNSSILRYNAFKIFRSKDRLLEILRENPHKTELFLISLLERKDVEQPFQSYLSLKIEIGFHIYNKRYDLAKNKLSTIFNNNSEFNNMPTFAQTWVRRGLIRCLVSLDKLGEAADIVVEAFFEKMFPYEHYIHTRLFELLSDPFEDRFSSHMSIPIMFEIYHLPSTSTYDVIANFLITNEVQKPSELFAKQDQWPKEVFHYFWKNVA